MAKLAKLSSEMAKREQEVCQHQQTNLNTCPEAMSETPFLPVRATEIVS